MLPYCPLGRDEYAPYQVALEDDHSLIYVPLDDNRYCREALAEDWRIIGRSDALAEDVVAVDEVKETHSINNTLNCFNNKEHDFHNHRNGSSIKISTYAEYMDNFPNDKSSQGRPR